ncbi:MAG: M3 family oligoendopeptidase [Phaeodactylibacter sp.]|nr:M3 family oligoendopeptidase [Phaeodactylibacter sp.]
MTGVVLPKAREKRFLPADFEVTDWDSLSPILSALKNRPIYSVEDLKQWLMDWSEVDSFLNEEFSKRYVAITTNTQDEEAQQRYQYAVQELLPNIAPFEDALNRKWVESPFVGQLTDPAFQIALRGVKNDVEIFREANIPLQTEAQLKQRDYGSLFSKMTIEHEGQELTFQQANVLLEDQDRALREKIHRQIHHRMLQDREALEDLFDDLVRLRHQMALNAGFDNYRDYKFKALGRFDFTVEDCEAFHNSVQKAIVPLVEQLHRIRKEKLGVDALRPWDLKVDWSGQPPLKPFDSVEDLVDKTVSCLSDIDPEFGETLQIMKAMEHLDLDSRTGKSPGGYNMPLHFTGVPFIFMNAANTQGDVFTLIHESGHAAHSLSMRDYPLSASKQPPSEVAELASMTMELLAMDACQVYFEDPKDLLRAKTTQLVDVLLTLPWVATIDKFQHWIYTHPAHSQEERKQAWLEIYQQFTSSVVNREGLEEFISYAWHRQLHIFEVPFYYIEYGMAQLGAIAIWKRFREQPEQAVQDFKEALRLGYTQTVGDIYEAAGVRFDFSSDYVQELAAFVWDELQVLIAEIETV